MEADAVTNSLRQIVAFWSTCVQEMLLWQTEDVISDLLNERKVKLILPAFTKKGMPLSEEDTTNTRRIANVRIHVERVIRRLKIFRILSQTVPVNLAHKLDKTLRICAALSNLRGDIIHEEED